jgi:nitrite reductase (NO-forming)
MSSTLSRYRHHLWVAGVSLVAIAAACVPYVTSQPGGPAVGAPIQAPAAVQSTAQLPTSLRVTVTEFKITPSIVQVPAGQKVTITLDNKGAVEHDLTVQALGFKVLAKAGQTATAEVTFDKPGEYELVCSIPGHKEAGMTGKLSVLAPGAAVTAQQPQATTVMPATGGMPMATGGTTADVQPLPAGLSPLPAPRIALPTFRSDSATVKLDLVSKEVTATLADGVAYRFWTFNGTVPGPMLRVREGDTVELSLDNDPNAGVTHSIDLHAVSGPGGGAKVMQVAPSETGTFRFQALNPGVYVYHCATPMVAHHIASGMYGLIVVEPKAGLPKVDREFYLMEGDFYLQGERGQQGLRAFDLDKMLDERPDYVLFNGGVGSLTGDNALKAKVGETIRIFFGVGGPNLTSSFHVIGAIFDRVFTEGSLTSPPSTNVQTTHVPAGGATMVEFTAKVPGTYPIVDHSLGRMEKGAAAQIVVEGDADAQIFQSIKTGSGGSGGH